MNRVRIGILEDDPDLRDYLEHELSDDNGFEVVFSCESVAEAKAAVKVTPPDICLVDLQLPDGNGSDFIKKLRRAAPGCKSLVLTALGDKSSVLVAFEAGANGYLLKDTPPGQIRSNIRAVIDGGNPISPQAATHLLGMLSLSQKAEPEAESPDAQSPDAKAANKSGLTAREREVLTLFAKGMSYGETAGVLGITTHTIQTYVKSIYRKLAVHSRNEAIFEALQNGWLDL